jgi:hypothetical protein
MRFGFQPCDLAMMDYPRISSTLTAFTNDGDYFLIDANTLLLVLHVDLKGVALVVTHELKFGSVWYATNLKCIDKCEHQSNDMVTCE